MTPAADARLGAVAAPVDRAAAVRRALRTLVAQRGFHGASMSAVAAKASVAVGTAYVHYESKDALVIAAYLEVKGHMGVAATAGIDADSPPHDRFIQMWHGIHSHLASDPDRARFLAQVDSSPYAAVAHERAMAVEEDPITAEALRPDMVALMAPLPVAVLYDLGFGPAVRLAAREVASASAEASAGAPDAESLGVETLRRVAEACWRAITSD